MTWPDEWPSGDAEDKGLAVDPLVEFLADNPITKKDYFVVVGLIGKAPEPNWWRIYLNYALSEFVEVAQDDVVYTATTADDRTRVWIESGAYIRHVVQRLTRAERSSYAPNRAATGRAGDGRYISGTIADWGEGLGEPDVEGEPVGSGCSCRPRSN